MPNSLRKKSALQSSVTSVDQLRRRVFDPHMPQGAVAHVVMQLDLDVQYLGPAKQAARSGDWFQQFLDKDRIQKEIDRLRQSVDQIAGGPECQNSSDTTLVVTSVDERFQELGKLLEVNPNAAAAVVLAGITDPSTDHPWRRLLVLAAESIHFTDTQDRELVPALLSFICRLRDSNDRDDQIAVCSAIRTYVGLATATDLDSAVAAILEPGHRVSPELDIVVEIVKMVSRKFAANPPATLNEHPVLAAQLEDIARAYLHPYVLPHGKNAAVAMNAVLAVIASASPGIQSLMVDVNGNCPVWFRQLLVRRLRRLLGDWRERLGDQTTAHEPTSLLKETIANVQLQ